MSGVDRISMLPEPILEKIFLLLPWEDAAHMTVISRVWRGFWAMFPIFNFAFEQKWPDVQGLRGPAFELKLHEEMLDFVNHVDQKLSNIPREKAIIQRFKLCLYFTDSASCVDDWIQLVTKNCIREVDVEMRESWLKVEKYCLPSSTFASTSLEFLRLTGCKLEKPVFAAGTNFCSLREVFLRDVCLDDEALHDIIYGCPALKCFALIECVGITKLEIPCLPRLTKVMVHARYQLTICASTMEHTSICTPLSISIATLECLRELDIESIQITDDLFHSLISKFPLLRILTLNHCFGMTRIKVSHCFLQKLNLTLKKGLLVMEIETPMLLSFTYGCDRLPDQLSINAPCLQESYLSMTTEFHVYLDTRWFVALRYYLSKFGQHDKITLHLRCKSAEFVLDELNDMEIPPLSVVKQLSLVKVSPEPSYDALLDGLLWTCRPILAIGHQLKENAIFIRFLCEKLIDGVEDPLCCMNSRIRCWRHFIRHVITENLSIIVEDRDGDAWGCLTWTDILIHLQWI